MFALVVSNLFAGLVAGSAFGTFLLCLWAVPHHREGRRRQRDRA